MSDEPLKVCPECQGKLTKVLYPTGVIFKGSGFYKTDYKSTSNGSTSSPEAKPETETETKTESKPESKPESKSGSDD